MNKRTRPFKTCPVCKTEKPLTDFYGHSLWQVQGYCKVCTRSYKKKYPERVRLWQTKSRLKRDYGISLAIYDEMYAAQKGCCAICKRAESDLKRRLGVDHDHKTNKVRGLLCDNCNKALGLLGDSIASFKHAITYLRPHV